MVKLAFKLLLLILIFSCGRKIPTSIQGNTASKIRILSIKSDNLSEEITGNDEIHWMVLLVNDSTPNTYVHKVVHDTLSFFQKDLHIPKKIHFEKSVSNLGHLQLIIILAEADTEISPEERLQRVAKTLQKGNFQPYDSLQTNLYENLLDDDLLGISFYKLSSLDPEGEFIFQGIHLFDKYYYRIKYQLE